MSILPCFKDAFPGERVTLLSTWLPDIKRYHFPLEELFDVLQSTSKIHLSTAHSTSLRKDLDTVDISQSRMSLQLQANSGLEAEQTRERICVYCQKRFAK